MPEIQSRHVEQETQGNKKEDKSSVALYKIAAFLKSKIKSEAIKIYCFCCFLELVWAVALSRIFYLSQSGFVSFDTGCTFSNNGYLDENYRKHSNTEGLFFWYTIQMPMFLKKYSED